MATGLMHRIADAVAKGVAQCKYTDNEAWMSLKAAEIARVLTAADAGTLRHDVLPALTEAYQAPYVPLVAVLQAKLGEHATGVNNIQGAASELLDADTYPELYVRLAHARKLVKVCHKLEAMGSLNMLKAITGALNEAFHVVPMLRDKDRAALAKFTALVERDYEENLLIDLVKHIEDAASADLARRASLQARGKVAKLAKMGEHVPASFIPDVRMLVDILSEGCTAADVAARNAEFSEEEEEILKDVVNDVWMGLARIPVVADAGVNAEWYSLAMRLM